MGREELPQLKTVTELLGEHVGTSDTARAMWRVSAVTDAALWVGEIAELGFPQDEFIVKYGFTVKQFCIGSCD